MHIGFWRESQKETGYQEHPAVGEEIILKWISEKYDAVLMDWIHLAQDRAQWRALMKRAIN
jgi:hypothetical protein